MRNFSLKMFVLTFFMSAVLLAGFSKSVYASVPPVQPIAICADQFVYADENCEQDASIDGGSFCECENGCVDPILTEEPDGPYILGSTFVQLTLECDGESASCDGEVVVIDDTPPEVTCPDDITVTDIWSCDDVVLDYEATATDNCEIGSDTCDPPSGSTFPEGVTQVTCASTDTSGNQTQCQFLVEVNGPPSCGTSYPEEQSYWHRQCLALPASEGGIDPGRSGRGPRELLEPDFDELMDCAEARLEDLGIFGVTTCEGMDADPPSDKCEKALKQLTALILNVCSERVSSCCEVDVSAYGCSSTNVGDLTQEIADLMQGGECRIASSCAAAVNEGLAIIDLCDAGAQGPGVFGLGRVYWASLVNYLNRVLSVDYELCAQDENVVDLMVVEAHASDGVTLAVSPPVSIGDIPSDTCVGLTLEWNVPVGVATFTHNVLATSEGYPEPFSITFPNCVITVPPPP